jgi:hypothetical protein
MTDMAEPLISLLYGLIVRARFRSTCCGCGRRIQPGHEIVRVHEGWAHAISTCIRKSASLTRTV